MIWQGSELGTTLENKNKNKILPIRLYFINVYTYPNPKPTLKVMQIH